MVKLLVVEYVEFINRPCNYMQLALSCLNVVYVSYTYICNMMSTSNLITIAYDAIKAFPFCSRGYHHRK